MLLARGSVLQWVAIYVSTHVRGPLCLCERVATSYHNQLGSFGELYLSIPVDITFRVDYT